METASAATAWQVWGLILVVGLPILVIMLGEVTQRLPAWGLGHYVKLLNLVRNSTLLLLFATILLRQVVGLPDTHLAVKIVDTLFWVTVLNAALVLFNTVVFESGATDWRARAPRLITDLGRIFMVALGAAFVVNYVWKVDLTGLLAALGVGSLVIGLALQDTLSNLFSGITMISARPFNVGDWIRVGDVDGQIRSIGWRAVTVATGAGDIVDIPNSQIAKDRFRVYGADNGRVAVPCDVKFGYEHPPETVKATLQDAALATKDILEVPAPVARIKSYEDAAVVYTLALYVADYRTVAAARSEFLSNLWYVADRRGLKFTAGAAAPAATVAATVAPADTVAAQPDAKAAARGLEDRLAELGTFQRPREALRGLVANAVVQRYRAGEILLRPGRRDEAGYVVLNGEARATTALAEGEAVVCTFARGDLILFKSFFRGGDAPFTVRGGTDLEVIRIPVAAFDAALAQDALLARQVERLLVSRESADKLVLGKLRPPSETYVDAADDRAKILRDLFRV